MKKSSAIVHRKGLSVLEKKELLKKYDLLPNLSQSDAALLLNISQATLSRLLLNRYEIESTSCSHENLSRKRKRCGKDEDVEKTLKKWFVEVREKGAPINGPLLKAKAEDLSKKLGKENFKATDGWLSRWRGRENIVYRKPHGEQAEADFTSANEWFIQEWPEISKNYSPSDIFNADETGLYYRALPEHTYALKSENTKGFKTSKERITLLCCASMAGEKKDLFVIGKFKNPQCFKDVTQLPIAYTANRNAWMTRDIFSDWLRNWDRQLKRKILLTIDNCGAHSNLEPMKNITVVYLPANTTSLIQPCDQGIIRTLKAYYRRTMRERIIQILDNQQNVKANDIAKKTSLLDALHQIKEAWSYVSSETIKNCFRKAGFVNGTNEICNISSNVSLNEIYPEDMTHEVFDEWIDIDECLETSGKPTDDDICQKLDTDESEIEEEDDSIEPAPNNLEMFNALQVLRRGVQHRSKSFEEMSKMKLEDDTSWSKGRQDLVSLSFLRDS
ncbi:tigger transposable element-derived protein 6-like [Trichogramma pretiosum]|uniref:tigger transposable element-derived protein 6-like n=1 Tax=Trichogramma pretiosum TaxID=7493 RepID=UPI000C718B1A|nr:tigger transposable element-derived protein 6-like [Trichogramma pretiosum]